MSCSVLRCLVDVLQCLAVSCSVLRCLAVISLTHFNCNDQSAWTEPFAWRYDNLVQEYIRAQNNRGVNISRNLVTHLAKVLITRNPGIVGDIDLQFSHYARECCDAWDLAVVYKQLSWKNLVVQKEAELVYHYDIVKKVETFSITPGIGYRIRSNT